MKKEIHPTSRPTIFVDTSSGVEFITTSTMESEKTRTIKGVEYQVCNIEISSASHPFYTGKQKYVDTAGRVDRFKAMQEKAVKMEAAKKSKKKPDKKKTDEKKQAKAKKTDKKKDKQVKPSPPAKKKSEPAKPEKQAPPKSKAKTKKKDS